MKKTIQKLKRLGAFDANELAKDIQELLCEVPQTATVGDIQRYLSKLSDSIDSTKHLSPKSRIKIIVSNIEDYLGLESGSICSRSRKAEISEARHLAQYISMSGGLGTNEFIGKHTGGVKYSTVITENIKVGFYIKNDKKYIEKYQYILKLYNLL